MDSDVLNEECPKEPVNKPTQVRLGRSIGIATLIGYGLTFILMMLFANGDYGTAGPVWGFLIVGLFLSFISSLFVFTYEIQTTGENRIEQFLRDIHSFNLSQFFVSTDRKVGIAIDETTKRIAIWVNYASRIFDARDILEFEIVEDGHTVNKVSRGSQAGGAIVGGALFGGIGAAVGGLSGKSKSKSKVTSLYMKIIVNDQKNPIVTLKYLDDPAGTSQDGFVYKTALQKIYHWHGLLTVLIRQATEIRDENIRSIKLVGDANLSVADELSKLSTLLEKGVITQAEFNIQKTKLLSL